MLNHNYLWYIFYSANIIATKLGEELLNTLSSSPGQYYMTTTEFVIEVTFTTRSKYPMDLLYKVMIFKVYNLLFWYV